MTFSLRVDGNPKLYPIIYAPVLNVSHRLTPVATSCRPFQGFWRFSFLRLPIAYAYGLTCGTTCVANVVGLFYVASNMAWSVGWASAYDDIGCCGAGFAWAG